MIYNRDGEEWHVNGTGIAGAPGVVLGCSSFSCWGMTVNPLDVTDFFGEAFLTHALGLPTHTIYKGNPEPIKQVFNSWYVNVIGDGVPNNLQRANVGYTEGAISLVIPRRNDGVVVDIAGQSGVSAMYTGFRDTHEFTAFLGFNKAQSLDEFLDAAQSFDIAVQNVYYADIEGSIAWFTTSEKPMREDLAAFTRYVYYELPRVVVERRERLCFVRDAEDLDLKRREAEAWVLEVPKVGLSQKL